MKYLHCTVEGWFGSFYRVFISAINKQNSWQPCAYHGVAHYQKVNTGMYGWQWIYFMYLFDTKQCHKWLLSHAHSANGKVINFVRLSIHGRENCQISRFRYLSYNFLCHQMVKSHEKPAPDRFKLLGTAYEQYKSCIFIAHAYQPCLSMPYVLFDCTCSRSR